MQQSRIDKNTQRRGQKKKKQREMMTREDNAEMNIVVKTIGRVTELYPFTSCCFSCHANFYVFDKEKINFT